MSTKFTSNGFEMLENYLDGDMLESSTFTTINLFKGFFVSYFNKYNYADDLFPIFKPSLWITLWILTVLGLS